MIAFEYTVTISRFGPDHVLVKRDALRNLVTIHRDAADIESIWQLDPDRWPTFLERIGQPDAPSVVDGVRLAVGEGRGAEVLTAASELGRLVFAEIDWDYARRADEREAARNNTADEPETPDEGCSVRT